MKFKVLDIRCIQSPDDEDVQEDFNIISALICLIFGVGGVMLALICLLPLCNVSIIEKTH